MDAAALVQILREDLSYLGEFLAAMAIVMSVPALVVGFVAAARTEPTLWRDLPLGISWCWLAGVATFGISILAFFGVVNLIEQATISVVFHRPLQIAIVGLGLGVFGFSVWVQYRTAVRYFRWRIKERLGWKIDEPLPPAANRWYSFSLRNLLLVQLALVIAFGLWVSSRRDRIRYRYERMQYAAWQADVQDRLGDHGWDLRHVYRPLRLESSERQLYDFSDEVLGKIEASDQLQHLEVNSDNLSDEGIKRIVVHERLQALQLRSEKITDAGIAQLTQLPNLQRLTITGPQLTDQALDNLQTMASLRWLLIYEAPISKAAQVRFQEARPEVDLFVVSRRPTIILPPATGQAP